MLQELFVLLTGGIPVDNLIRYSKFSDHELNIASA